MSFTQFDLKKNLTDAVADAGYSTPTAIQNKAIPHILEGRDLIGCAQTGTGKTAAFALPILQHLIGNASPSGTRVLILSPTRELAIQIEDTFLQLGKNTHIKSLAIFGGVSQVKQVAALQKGINVLIATPGRLLDLMQQGIIKLSNIEILVLDEADRMLDMGFVKDVKKIISAIPKKRQTLFFSATMPENIRVFANSILHEPVEVAVTPISSTAPKVLQSVFFVEKKEKSDLLVHVLKDKTISRSLVFTRTKHGADRLVKHLLRNGIYAAAIHGNKSQNNRQKALEDFKNSKIRILVATDIASRGLDINELPHVVNYELPNIPETYVHRIGRTGRAGQNGIAISFCDNEEKKDLNNIQKLIGFKMPIQEIMNN